MTSSPSNSLAPFLQTSVFFPDEFDEFRTKFLALYRDISSNVNVRQIGIFDLQEFLTGERWFSTGDPQKKRQTFRRTYEIPAIAPGASLILPHGLTGVTAYTHIYGTVITSIVDYRPLPYSSTAGVAENISLRVDLGTASIVIDNGAISPAITSGLVVLEFLKN